MVTSIARQSVILKCNMQKAVMLGNYEFYYGAGVAGKIGGFEIPDDIKPLELRELLDKKLDQISPKDEKETYLIHILKEFRPDELYDGQMKELLLWGKKKTDVRRFRTKPSTLPHPAFNGCKKALKKKVKNS